MLTLAHLPTRVILTLATTLLKDGFSDVHRAQYAKIERYCARCFTQEWNSKHIKPWADKRQTPSYVDSEGITPHALDRSGVPGVLEVAGIRVGSLKGDPTQELLTSMFGNWSCEPPITGQLQMTDGSTQHYKLVDGVWFHA